MLARQMTKNVLRFYAAATPKLRTCEVNSLLKRGFTPAQIDHVARQMQQFEALNKIDDGYGMPPMTRQELFDLVLERSQPKNQTPKPGSTA